MREPRERGARARQSRHRANGERRAVELCRQATEKVHHFMARACGVARARASTEGWRDRTRASRWRRHRHRRAVRPSVAVADATGGVGVDDDVSKVLNAPDVALARRAARAAMRVIAGDATVSIASVKRDRTVATTVDVAAQVVCREALGDAGAAFVGEETSVDGDEDALRAVSRAASRSVDDVRAALEECDGILSAPRYWCCDPLDGTKAFIEAVDSGKQYVFGLARVDGERGDADVAVMIAPKWYDGCGVELVAMRGGGCFARRLDAADDAFARVCAGQPNDLSDDAVRVVISQHESWSDLPLGRAGVRPKSITPLCCGSLCKYVAVALGEADIFIQHPKSNGDAYVNAWDHAAGVLCCQEAGAIVSDCHGGVLDMRGPDVERRRRFAPAGGGVVIASASIHTDVVRAYRAGLAQ